MDTKFKVPSNETEDITDTQNNLNFDIPEGVYNLKKSYVEMKVLISNASSGEAGHANAVFNIEGAVTSHTGGGGGNRYVPPVALVKHARLTSDMKGNIEELRHVNLIRLSEKQIYEHQDQLVGGAYHNCMGIKKAEKYGALSPLIEVSAESGTGTGRYVEKSIRIPVPDILQVGSSMLFDCNRLGRCRLHLEIDRGRLVPQGGSYQQLYFTDKVIGGKTGFGNGVLKNITAAGDVTQAILGDATTPGNAKVYDEDYMEHIPYYVGMPIKVPSGANNGTVDGANIAAAAYSTITDISYDVSTGNVTLSFSDALFTVAAAGSVGVHIQPVPNNEVTTKELTLNQAKLVLHELGSNNLPSEMPPSLSFTKIVQEQDFAGNISNFKRQYEMENNAVNMLMVMKVGNNDLFSDKKYDSYRVSVNNELTTDRDIFRHCPLAHHKLNMFALNQGKEIVNLAFKSTLRNQTTDPDDENADNDLGNIEDQTIIAEPLPITANMKLVQFEINNAQNTGEVAIYKYVVASV